MQNFVIVPYIKKFRRAIRPLQTKRVIRAKNLCAMLDISTNKN